MLITLTLSLQITTAAGVYLTSENFANPRPTLSPEKDYYNVGDQISLTYKIGPRTDNDAPKLTGDAAGASRYYVICTALDNPVWSVTIDYINGPRIYPNIKPGSECATVEIKYWEDGLQSILVTLTGKIPSIDKRFEEKAILWVTVSDADIDCLPKVVVKIVNKNKFVSDISDLKSKISEFEQKLSSLEDEGADVDVAEEYLINAKKALTDGESLYSQNKFSEADAKLNGVESNLSKVSTELVKAELTLEYNRAEDKFRAVQTKILELEYLIQQAKEKNENVIKYEVELSELKDFEEDLDSELKKIRSYIEEEKFELAKKKIQKFMDKAETVENRAKEVIAELSTTQQEEEKEENTNTFILSAILQSLAGIASLLTSRELMYILGIILLVILLILLLRGRRGREWDELR